MTTTRIDRYWGERFGCDAELFDRAGVHVVAQPRGWRADRVDALVRAQTAIVAVPATEVVTVARRAAEHTPPQLTSAAALAALRQRQPRDDGAPRFQGVAEAEDLQWPVDERVRELSAADTLALAALRGSVRDEDWQSAGVGRGDSPTWGAFLGDALAAVALYSEWGSEAASIGVVTDPRHRGQGLGKAVVAAAARHAFARGRFALYETPAANAYSIQLCRGLGFRHYGDLWRVPLAAD